MTTRRLAIFLAAVMIVAAATAFYFASTAPVAGAKGPQAASRPAISPVSLPLFFEANQGQTDPRVKFLARGHGYGLFLTSNEAVLKLQRSSAVETRLAASPRRDETPTANVIRMRLDGANSAARISGAEPLPGKSNYFIGNDPKKWHSGIPQFARVNYASVYLGIDLTYYAHQGQLEYDFRVAPNADPNQIVLSFEGASTRLDGAELVLSTSHGDVRFQAPTIYQQAGNAKKLVSGRFRQLASNKIGFQVGPYDRSRELVIDPVLTYATYLGGGGTEAGVQVAVDSSLNIYLAGSTDSADFPLSQPPNPPPIQSTLNVPGAQNLFIAKLNPSAADQLAFATYLGGNGIDAAAGLAVDAAGDIYVAGTTTSSNFPTTTNAFQQSAAQAGTHGFVSRIGFTGTLYVLSYSTYLAGTNAANNPADLVTGLAIDSKKDAFVTGTTTSTDAATGFPATANGYQVTSFAANQFFASKINTDPPGASSMLYSTYFGGVNPANAQISGGGIAIDNGGNFYITGATSFLFDPTASADNPRTNFPILNAQQACLDQAPSVTACDLTQTAQDAFVAKINPGRVGAAGLVYSTYLGGSQDDDGLAIAVDSADNAYVTGKTLSSDWTPPSSPTPFQNAFFVPQPVNVFDAFIAKIGNPSGSTTYPLTYFTYLGGSGDDIGRAIAVDTVQTVHVTGSTSSGSDSLVPFDPLDIPQPPSGGATHAFVTQIITTASGRAAGDYLTFLGGTNADLGTGIALDASNTVYVSGQTNSTDFPVTPDAFQSQLNPSHLADAFVARIGAISGFAYSTTTPLTVNPNPASVGNQVTITFTFVNNGPDPASKVVFSGSIPATGVTFISATASPGGACPTPVSATVVCQIGSVAVAGKATVTVVLTPLLGTKSVDVTPTLSVNGGGFVPLPCPVVPPTPCPLPVSVTDFAITAAPTSITVNAGDPAVTYTVTLSPTSILGYAGQISMSVTGLPSNTTSAFSPPTPVTISGSSPASRTLSITTTHRPVTGGSLLRGGPIYATWLPVGGLSLFGLGLGAGLKRRRWLAGTLLGLLAGLIVLQAACGNSNSTPAPTGGTPAGTYPIIITGSSGSASHNALPVTLIVN